jgi:hypothetical protein
VQHPVKGPQNGHWSSYGLIGNIYEKERSS